MRKMLSAVIMIVCAVSLSSCLAKKPLEPVSQTAFVLDTVATITLYDYPEDSDPNEIINQSFGLCSEYEKKLSRTIETSDIYKINTAKGQPVEVSDETIELIETAIKFSELTDGKFDITIAPVSSLWDFKAENPVPPSDESIKNGLAHVGYKNIQINGNEISLADPEAALDLGGIGKGYIGDKVKEYLLNQGVTNAVIDLGGNLLVICPENQPERFGIQKPFYDYGVLMGAVESSGNSIVTSGVYERDFEYNGKLYHHLLDTSTGYPVENDLYSVVIIGPSSAYCDALSTSLFCLGTEKGLELINSMDGYEAIFINNKYETIFSNGINKTVPYLTGGQISNGVG